MKHPSHSCIIWTLLTGIFTIVMFATTAMAELHIRIDQTTGAVLGVQQKKDGKVIDPDPPETYILTTAKRPSG